MKRRVCPWWLGYVLINPIRKYRHNPDKILGQYINPGMKAVDFGSAMGYFSLPMASMVGDAGKVYCFDIQKKMLEKLEKRAIDAGLDHLIESRLIEEDKNVYADLNGTIDFILLCAVAHEIPDKVSLFSNLYSMLKKDGMLLFMEPAGHVSVNDFRNSIIIAEKAGFRKIDMLQIRKTLKVLLRK